MPRTLPPELTALFDDTARLLATGPDGMPERVVTLCCVTQTPTVRAVLVGSFSAGKSTLLNALLGRELMPAGANPTTAIPTVVSHGPRLHVTATTRAGKDETLTLKQYAQACALGSPLAGRYQMAHMRVPVPELASGLELVDLPGLFDHDDQDEITRAFLHDADVVIMVTPAVGGLTMAERDFLTDLAAIGVRNLLLVVTKCDTVRPASELPQVRLRSLGLAATIGIPAERVVLVAAEPALQALTSDAGPNGAVGDGGIPRLWVVLDECAHAAGAGKDARAVQRLVALVATAREEATARARRPAGRNTLSRLAELARLERRCLVVQATGSDAGSIGGFVRGIPVTALPPPGPDRAVAVLRTALAALSATEAPAGLGLEPAAGTLATLARRIPDVNAMTPGEISNLERALTMLWTATRTAVDRLESQLADLTRINLNTSRLVSAAQTGVTDQLKHVAKNRITRFCNRVTDEASSWAGRADPSASRIFWRESVDNHVSTITRRLLDHLSGTYQDFLTTDLRERLHHVAHAALSAAAYLDHLDVALDRVDAALAEMAARRTLAPAHVPRPARHYSRGRLPAVPTPSLDLDSFRPRANQAKNRSISTDSSLGWALDFLADGAAYWLNKSFTPGVVKEFQSWSGEAIRDTLKKPLATWIDKVDATLEDASEQSAREIRAGMTAAMQACAAATADTEAELVRLTRLGAEIRALRRSLDADR